MAKGGWKTGTCVNLEGRRLGKMTFVSAEDSVYASLIDNRGWLIKGKFGLCLHATLRCPSGRAREPRKEGIAVSLPDEDVETTRLAVSVPGFRGSGSETTRRVAQGTLDILILLDLSSLRSRRRSLLPISQSVFLLLVGNEASECLSRVRVNAALGGKGRILNTLGEGVCSVFCSELCDVVAGMKSFSRAPC